MNSEELELSLRSEFENYLRTFRSEIKQEAAELQKRLDEAFEAYAARFDSDAQPLDDAFTSTVTEHLRLARDEGAKLTATAMVEAEQLERESGAASDYSAMRDAVADISSQTSQSAILGSLVTHAEAFAPRGAFFIIKNESFVGWKAFGAQSDDAESAVRDIHFPVSADTILGRAVESMATVGSAYGAHPHDESFLDPLQFGRPDRMYAVPLTARGRGVAVLYADHGPGGSKVSVEALEILVRVAGVTVELLAAAHSANAEGRDAGKADFEQAHHEGMQEAAPSYPEPVAAEYEHQAADFTFGEGPAASTFETPPVEATPEFAEEPAVEEPVAEEPAFEPVAEFDAGEPAEVEAEEFRPEPEAEETEGEMVFDSGAAIEEPVREPVPSPFETTAQGEPAGVGVIGGVVEAGPQTSGYARLRDRPVDLPIDVAEDERRLHNDARRFARLLVSEIKLYNEKKVQEGRQANDLYERLREAIDRSREMYDKRVQPPVAAKFDYFHYELVNALAEGNAEHLGSNYPGSSV